MCEHAAGIDARSMHVGRYSAWLTKAKSDGARARWFSSSTNRYFTVDFEAQIFFYSQNEDRKNSSSFTYFKDIVGAEMLPRQAKNPHSKTNTYGFVLKTNERNFELYTITYLDSKHWVDGLNAARDIAKGVMVAEAHKDRDSLSRASMSTTDGMDPYTARTNGSDSVPSSVERTPYGAPPSTGGYGGRAPPPAMPAERSMPRLGPVGRSMPAPTQSQPPRAPWPGSAPKAEKPKPWEQPEQFAPKPAELDDPFAALDALEELAGPIENLDAPAPTASAEFQAQMLRDAKRLVTEGRKPWPGQHPAVQAPTPARAPGSQAPAAPVPQPPSPPPPGPGTRGPMQDFQPVVFHAGPGKAGTNEPPARSPPQRNLEWDSDCEDMSPPSPPPAAPKPAAVISSAALAPLPAAPRPPAAAAQGDSWDSDDETAAPKPPQPPVQTAYVGDGPAVQQHGAESAGWDDDDVPAPRPKAPAGPLNTCGAPQRPAEAFVAAAPVVQQKKAEPTDDLDDLLGDVLAVSSSTKRAPGDSWLVPDFQCTSCDFQVLCIDDFVWRGEVEYMFFRNNYPNVAKLRSGLQLVKGCRAYCCQCAWKSADAAADLAAVADGLRWVQVGRQA